MSFDPLRQRYDNFYVPRFEAHLADRVLRESDGIISDLSIETILDGADRFSFTLNYPFDRDTGRFAEFEWDAWEPETEVKLTLGYGETLQRALVGRIQSVNPEFPAQGGPTVAVSGFGLLHALTKDTRSRSWNNRTLGDVVDEVLTPYPIQKKINGADLRRRKIYQDKQNDLQFLTKLANDYGFDFFADLDAVYFRPHRLTRPKAGLALRYGESLSSFSPELNRADHVKTVEVRHWNSETKKEIVGKATHSEGSGKRVLRRPVESKQDAEEIAQTVLNRLSNGTVQGTGETIGIPELRAGTVLELDGIGERFSRTYYITNATHRMGSGGYQTSFQVTERVT